MTKFTVSASVKNTWKKTFINQQKALEANFCNVHFYYRIYKILIKRRMAQKLNVKKAKQNVTPKENKIPLFEIGLKKRLMKFRATMSGIFLKY